MKVIVAGSRSITDATVVAKAIAGSGFEITELVCGRARGVDELGKLWAQERGIPVVLFLALWRRHGRSAGAIRNLAMARYADALVAIWDGESPGTRNMIDAMKILGKPVFVVCHRP
jgi:threonine/homoserine efflux transporter RhtA